MQHGQGGSHDPDARPVDPGKGTPASQQYEGPPYPEHSRPDPQATVGEQRPAVVLDELIDDLRHADTDVQAARQRFEALQADVNALKKASEDLDKAVQQYGQAKGNLDQQLHAQQEYDKENGQVIENAVDDEKGKVDQAWDKVTQELEDLRNKRDQYWDALNAATDEYTKKQRPVQKAQKEFEALKGRMTDLQQQLKGLGDLQKSIVAAQQEPDPIKMYALLLEFRARLHGVEKDLLAVDGYREALYDAWRALNNVQDALRAAGEAKTKAQQAYDDTKAKLEALESGRVDAVLKGIPPSAADDARQQ